MQNALKHAKNENPTLLIETYGQSQGRVCAKVRRHPYHAEGQQPRGPASVSAADLPVQLYLSAIGSLLHLLHFSAPQGFINKIRPNSVRRCILINYFGWQKCTPDSTGLVSRHADSAEKENGEVCALRGGVERTRSKSLHAEMYQNMKNVGKAPVGSRGCSECQSLDPCAQFHFPRR